MEIPEFHVLLIEDSQGDARILRELLACAKTARFVVECADRLTTGSEHLRRGDFDVVLLDLGLPDSQGLGTFLEVHARSPELPVVVLSGMEDETLALRAVQEGAQDYLVKGEVDANVLERTLRYAIERVRAEEGIRTEQRLLRRLLQLQERERKLLAYEIHDGFIQDVVGAKLITESMHHEMEKQKCSSLPQLEIVRELLGKAINEGRRMISDLRPMIIDEQGIIVAIQYLISEARPEGELEVTFHHETRFDRLPPLLENVIFRIVQEALTNVRRHSQAGKAEVNVTQDSDQVFIEIRDNGIGFDRAQVPDDRFGLRGIEERARLFEGSAVIESTVGEGSRVFVELPLALRSAKEDPIVG